MKDTDKHRNWTWKDGWEHFKKAVSRPEKVNSIQDGLSKLTSKLIIIDNMLVVDRNRHSQIYSSFADDSISIDFWENGVCWHSAFLKDISKVSLALYLWNDIRTSSDRIEHEIPELKFPVKRKKIEKGNQEYIKWHWDNLVKTRNFQFAEETLLFELLAKDERINKLMTFDSLWYFGLSEYIGEYGNNLKNDLPLIEIRNERFHILSHEQANLKFKGELNDTKTVTDSYKKAYEFLQELLPTEISWAEYQTVEEFDSRINKSGS